jgi:hypothetical protein
MALIKLNNRAVKDATAFGSISSLGSLTFISKQTASSSASISFTSGIDSSFKEYMFVFNNIHASANARLTWQASTDGGSTYNTVCTTTAFGAAHNESGSFTQLAYSTGYDAAQSTSFIPLATETFATENDDSYSGTLHFFNPSSTTYVKHFMLQADQVNTSGAARYVTREMIAGYFNTTSAINAVQFKMASGNIDDGTISLFGIA